MKLFPWQSNAVFPPSSYAQFSTACDTLICLALSLRSWGPVVGAPSVKCCNWPVDLRRINMTERRYLKVTAIPSHIHLWKCWNPSFWIESLCQYLFFRMVVPNQWGAKKCHALISYFGKVTSWTFDIWKVSWAMLVPFQPFNLTGWSPYTALH